MYAHRPLELKGATQAHWASGFVLPAAQINTGGSATRIYYEARKLRHENRFEAPGVIGVASWEEDRLVGLRCAGYRHVTDKYRAVHADGRRDTWSVRGRPGLGAGLSSRSMAEEWPDCELKTKLFEVEEMVLSVDVVVPSHAELEIAVVSR